MILLSALTAPQWQMQLLFSNLILKPIIFDVLYFVFFSVMASKTSNVLPSTSGLTARFEVEWCCESSGISSSRHGGKRRRKGFSKLSSSKIKAMMQRFSKVGSFVDSHCHFDFLVDFNYDPYLKCISDRHGHYCPSSFRGCVQVFCDPKRFNLSGEYLSVFFA